MTTQAPSVAFPPVVFYPHSKTLWMALDLYFHPEKGVEAAVR